MQARTNPDQAGPIVIPTNSPRVLPIRVVRGIGVLLVILLLPPPLHAQYLDPGSGSILIQVLLGGVVGLAAILKLYWHKIRGILPGAKRAVRHDN
ncbi:MAG TPA: hypothetical protein VGQ24_05150 [Gemmatimonadales bacterium]|jgi:hypothetical protein|nr:hypothetical protein [Gemmatimonadales bacterium]